MLGRDVERCIVGKKVYLDTAVVFGAIDDGQFVRICRNHGTDRILFATDSPWSGQTESIEYMNGTSTDTRGKKQDFSTRKCPETIDFINLHMLYYNGMPHNEVMKFCL